MRFIALFLAPLVSVPYVSQKPDFCGEACAEMALRRLGSAIDQDDVFALSGVNPKEGRGAYTKELKLALEKIGFDVGPVWYSFPTSEARANLERIFAEVKDDLARGIPSIVCTHFDETPDTTEHFRLLIGVDGDEVVYHDPAVRASMRMRRERLFALWPLKYDTNVWTVIRFRMAPKKIIERPVHSQAAELAQHVMRVPKKYSIAIESPFVVISEGQSRGQAIVRWTIEKLLEDFFAKKPDKILDVWLLSNPTSYARVAKQLTGEPPDTPYGFFSPSANALIMNIATGGGTLVHEIVHPFMEANFPSVPPWYNEGLGSLFEASGEQRGHIVGYLNWRLAGLQSAIKKRTLPSFAELMAMGSHQFYEEDRGDNYAQARYLLYYLQERGLLLTFHREFLKWHKLDPTGVKTLRHVLHEDDLREFQRGWEKWVLTLKLAA
jgi:hypothetical protein